MDLHNNSTDLTVRPLPDCREDNQAALGSSSDGAGEDGHFIDAGPIGDDGDDELGLDDASSLDFFAANSHSPEQDLHDDAIEDECVSQPNTASDGSAAVHHALIEKALSTKFDLSKPNSWVPGTSAHSKPRGELATPRRVSVVTSGLAAASKTRSAKGKVEVQTGGEGPSRSSAWL
jgi:hypothetical protein